MGRKRCFPHPNSHTHTYTYPAYPYNDRVFSRLFSLAFYPPTHKPAPTFIHNQFTGLFGKRSKGFGGEIACGRQSNFRPTGTGRVGRRRFFCRHRFLFCCPLRWLDFISTFFFLSTADQRMVLSGLNGLLVLKCLSCYVDRSF